VPQLPRIAATAFAIVGLVMAGACGPIRVRSFTEPGVNLANYHSYAWTTDTDYATGDPRLDNNPFFRTRLMDAVDHELSRRGFEKRETPPPDVLVHFHARISQAVDVSAVDQRYGACQNCGASVYDAGSILIDFVDARTDKLAWRGWAETSMEGSIDNQRLMEQQIDEAVAKILQQLPGRSS
jgi:hypothetical protein